MDSQFKGVIPDPRPYEETQKDYVHGEIASFPPIHWIEKLPSTWKTASVRDQDGSSSCVAQATTTALEMLTNTVESARPIYRNRSNYPYPGMWLQSAGDVMRNIGTTNEQILPSQLLSENKMNANYTEATPLKIDSYVFIPYNDIESMAQILEGGTPLIMTFRSTDAEWTNVPQVNPTSTGFWLHCVCATDYTLYNGQKALVISDSWGHATTIGSGGQRVITRDYILNRCTGVMYLIPKQPIPKPLYYFTKVMSYGQQSEDIRNLQICLQYLGMFPQTQYPTGFYGSITARAVQKYQISHGILDFQFELDLRKIRAGVKTMNQLNIDFSVA